jgi:hypothetical protein
MRNLLFITLLAASACNSAASRGSPDEAIPDALFDTGIDAVADVVSVDSPANDANADAAVEAFDDAGVEVGDDTLLDTGDDAAFDLQLDAGNDVANDALDELFPDTEDPEAGNADVTAAWADTLDSNRNRLLGTYFAFLKASATTPQSNGLSGNNVSNVCDVWNGLDPSSRAVFLTLSARLQGSRIGIDGSSMLWHVVEIYRIVGGQNATSTDPGSCGGGEYNRMIMSQDQTLHAALLAANQHKGALQSNGQYDIADAPTGTFWRDSHDLAGAHAPFDLSDETDKGAPRGQTQYFRDPTSALANAPLGRQDIPALVDPLALEMDLDYDCLHNSNPQCSYTLYGPLCMPASTKIGTDIFVQSYGAIDADFRPVGCL